MHTNNINSIQLAEGFQSMIWNITWWLLILDGERDLKQKKIGEIVKFSIAKQLKVCENYDRDNACTNSFSSGLLKHCMRGCDEEY